MNTDFTLIERLRTSDLEENRNALDILCLEAADELKAQAKVIAKQEADYALLLKRYRRRETIIDNVREAVRESLLSEEFLKEFAAAFSQTPLPSTIEPGPNGTWVNP